MIVVSCSLDSSLEQAKLQGTLLADKQRYEIFKKYGTVVLLTQDNKNFTNELQSITHVPCLQSNSIVIANTIYKIRFLRWIYFYFFSFFWFMKNKSKVNVIVTENITSPTPFIFSLFVKVSIFVHYHYDVSNQVTNVNKNRLEGIVLLFLERVLFKRATCVWVTAPSLAKKVKIFGAKRVSYLPNWYKFEKISEERTINRNQIIFVGRLHPVKQVDLLLKAFHIVRNSFPSLRLKIIGDGQERESLKKITKSLNIENSVEFLGFKPHDIVLERMKESILFVLTSKMEGNPKVLIEAMMLKLPIVATKVIGIKDMIQDDVTGVLATTETPEDVAKSMNKILQNGKYADYISNNAYEFAKEKFSEEQAFKTINKDFLLTKTIKPR